MEEEMIMPEIVDFYYKDMSDELKVIIKEMCKRVKAPYTQINFGQPGWQALFEWTEEENEDFKNWLINYLYKAPAKTRRAILGNNIKNKKYLTEAVAYFMLNYSWVVKNNNDILGVR